MSDTNIEGLVKEGIETGMAQQGRIFEFKRPADRTAEEGLTLPELVFQAIGAACAEGVAARDNESAINYTNLMDIGHQLLGHVADQSRV